MSYAIKELLCLSLLILVEPGINIKKDQPLPSSALLDYGRKAFILGFVLFTFSTGGNVGKLINPLDAQYVEQVGGSFGNYLGLSLNFLYLSGECSGKSQP